MYAIVDCNSFYCSCERVFRPELADKPVVVLSNNDGCIISRCDMAKEIGVDMAGPYFLAKPLILKHGVTVFSSNYNLYGDMSWRVMEVLRQMAGRENVEVYSVDEAFIMLDGFPDADLRALAQTIKNKIELWTGVCVSIGIAPTKTLAKLANYIAKKNKIKTGCIALLENEDTITRALKMASVKDLWGVGGQSVKKLTQLGIHTAWDLRQVPVEWARKNLGGVVGVRLIKELQGEKAILVNEYKDKKMIATTRMFGDAVSSITDIKEAVATYTSRAAEKLRRQHCAATTIQVFVVTNEKSNHGPQFIHGPTYSRHKILASPTSNTNELIKPALQLAEQLFEEGKKYKKAGVMLSGIVPQHSIQSNLFEEQKKVGRFLMDQIDNINFSMRGDVVKFASAGMKRNWKMRKEFHSPRYTTRWEELLNVR